MSTTSPHAPGEFGEPSARTAPARGPAYYVWKGVKALASLQLTVVLFTLGILLIFFGTLAQLDHGIWTVVDQYFASFIVWVPFELIHKFLGVFWKEQFAGGSAWVGSFPLPAGYTIGGAMIINLLAAHALRFRLTWKRAGIFLIHGGVILLFVGEATTRWFAVEQQMTIPQGQSVDFAEDSRNMELAFIDRSGATEDKVTVIAQKRLMSAVGGARIAHPDLPVDVEVLKFMKNSDFRDPRPGVDNPATTGAGTELIAVDVPEVSGVDTSSRRNMPSAYVRFYKKGTNETLGTYFVSLLLSLQNHSDPLQVDGATYHVTLRHARLYKPYRVHLDKFSFDRYVGTSKPKNYSSDVRVFDADGNQVREQRIAMNEPMRYAGETFYQSSFDKAETTTILQVVKNPGLINFGLFYATIDYIACAIVSIGLLLHFSIYLIQFLLRMAPKQTVVLTGYARLFPWAMLALAAVGLLAVFGRMTPREYREPYDLNNFARIPVIEGGRQKPLETVARVYLRTISHRETFVDDKGDTQPAIRWYIDVLAAGGLDDDSPAWDHKVFRIENDQVLADLKLPRREGLRYSWKEIRTQRAELEARAGNARRKARAKKPLDLAESKMIELEDRIGIVQSLNRRKGLNLREEDTLRLLPPEGENGKWQSLGALRDEAELAGLKAAQEALRADPDRLFKLSPQEGQMFLRTIARTDVSRLDEDLQMQMMVRAVQMLRMPAKDVPPEFRPVLLEAAYIALKPEDAARVRATADQELKARTTPAALGWERMISAYRAGKADEFNNAVADYRRDHLANVSDTHETSNWAGRRFYAIFNTLGANRTEIVYNRFAPFFQCTGFYVLGLLLALVGFVLYVAEVPHWAVALRRSAFYVLGLTLAVHMTALLARMYIMERPGVFVTNLYSSAVFIGCGCVALCLVLEVIFRIGVGNAVAAVLGLATTIVAHNIGTNDTLEMMEAVLDTNFWLATHVTTVTLGYTATFVAGFIGALYVTMLLGAVIRDSFQSTGEPTVGALFAFGVAAVGVVGIPIAFLAFMATALDKFELVHPFLLWVVFYLILALGALYALGLMLMRVGMEGTDPHGKPLAGHIPGLAKPVVALALTPESGKILGMMVYGVLCFATMLSFIGTVLGGIWADQSWGRFWGWDPKENGAVLIVLWNALILHARWCGLVKDRGTAVLAIFGNVVTAWSWFGTNQLGIGLHAYGFDSRLADGCFNFWASQLFILGLGLIPARFWPSAARRAAVPTVISASVPAPAIPVAPAPAQHGSPNGVPPASPNGNGHVNGKPNGPTRRDKKKHGKRR